MFNDDREARKLRYEERRERLEKVTKRFSFGSGNMDPGIQLLLPSMAMKERYEVVAAEIKISDDIMHDSPSPEMEEELMYKLLELGRNGFVVSPGFSQGRWLSNRGGTFYDTALLYECGRQNELKAFGVQPHTWPFPGW